MARTMTPKGLTRAQLKRFRQMLVDKAEEIRSNLRSGAASKALARGEEPLDEEELPSQSHEEWIFLNRNNIDVMLLREIDEALVRMTVGMVGREADAANAWNLAADIQDFEITMRKDGGDWKVLYAKRSGG